MTPNRSSALPDRIRRQIRVRGVVQGVGFRPYVYRQARAYGLVGFVCNDVAGVLIEVEGVLSAVDGFLDALPQQIPGGAIVQSIEATDAALAADVDFAIVASAASSGGAVSGAVPVSPDRATCQACWDEFHDPTDRRYLYPFINCTQCGPRYTIVRGVPYDRPLTTMASFTMCAECQAEYDDPASRRFHAQPNACPCCGPSLKWVSATAQWQHATTVAHEAVLSARIQLQTGGVLAVKGIGGYHLVCDARSTRAVDTLRQRKRRADKPLAVMVGSLDDARRYAEISDAAAALMCSPAHPIVLVPRRVDPKYPLADGIAPAMDTIGLLLPYSPIHALLTVDGPIVCTSANLSDEPIVYDDAKALDCLAPLVDGFLIHNRTIHVPCDDSVVQLHDDGAEMPMRRSRGYAPMPVHVVSGSSRTLVPDVLAVGAELKSTIAVTRREQVFLSAHLGDVGDPSTLEALAHAVDHMTALHGVVPARVACDLHPGYLSSRWAAAYASARSLPLVPVQHHHAHLAALLAERATVATQSILAFTFDGTGYGTDGTIWGGEALLGNYDRAERVASLAPFLLPGGDAAVKHPARTALALLHASAMAWDDHWPVVRDGSANERHILRTQLDRRLGCAETTSMGRFFDACAALLGVRYHVSYEGQAAVLLEQVAHHHVGAAPPLSFTIDVAPDDRLLLSPVALLHDLLREIRRGVALPALAYAIHAAVADAVLRVATQCRDRYGAYPVGLTGGVFQNRLLTRLTRERLVSAGFTTWEHRTVPANDGGLALGQAAIAWHRVMSS